jgi:hypothetical protein
MAEQERDDFENRLKKFGWTRGPHKRYPDGVEVRLRRVPDTSGEGERGIFGTDPDDAIRKEVERLEAEGAVSEP